jgi:hypothetical protein
MHSSVESCFPRPRALYFSAPGEGPFLPPAHVLQIGASGGAKTGPARYPFTARRNGGLAHQLFVRMLEMLLANPANCISKKKKSCKL